MEGTRRLSMRHIPLFVFLSVVALMAGCASKKEVVRQEPPVKAREAEYSDALNKRTRSIKIYEGFDARLYLSATYKDAAFREAYINRYAASVQMDDAYKKTLLEREAEEAERTNEFFFSAYTPEERWNDFDQRDSLWRLFLEDNTGKKLTPISVKKIDRSDPLLREMFPYMDLWSQGYIVRFPRYSDTGVDPVPGKASTFLKITVTGILGKGEITWKLKD